MIKLNFQPFPVLLSEHIELINLKDEHATELYRLWSQEGVMPYRTKRNPQTIVEALAEIMSVRDDVRLNRSITWGVQVKGENGICGTVGFKTIDKVNGRGNLVFGFCREYWDAGMAKEALGRVLDYAFNVMGLHSVQFDLVPANADAASFIAKKGFKREALFRESFLHNGQWLDTEVYGLLGTEWNQRRILQVQELHD